MNTVNLLQAKVNGKMFVLVFGQSWIEVGRAFWKNLPGINQEIEIEDEKRMKLSIVTASYNYRPWRY